MDGCHLEASHGGVFLIVVGIDANNNLFLIAGVVVCKEYKEIRKWFLTILNKT